MTLDLGVGLRMLCYKREVWNECWWEEGRGSHRRWERGIHRSVPDLVLVALLHMCG